MNQQRNYSRFFGILKRIPGVPDRDQIVAQYTKGRTTSLKEMECWEYEGMCDELDKKFKDPRTTARSAALKLMQQLGIDTTDWNRINAFCRDSRIAGMEFYDLKVPQLEALAVKLRGIQRKGGLNHQLPAQPQPQPKPASAVVFFPAYDGLPN